MDEMIKDMIKDEVNNSMNRGEDVYDNFIISLFIDDLGLGDLDGIQIMEIE